MSTLVLFICTIIVTFLFYIDVNAHLGMKAYAVKPMLTIAWDTRVKIMQHVLISLGLISAHVLEDLQGTDAKLK